MLTCRSQISNGSKMLPTYSSMWIGHIQGEGVIHKILLDSSLVISIILILNTLPINIILILNTLPINIILILNTLPINIILILNVTN